MTPQEAVNLSYSRLAAQGAPSMSEGGFCYYSTLPAEPDKPERFCAVGILLEPKIARALDTGTDYSPPERFQTACAKLGLDLGFARNLQVCHDRTLPESFLPSLTEAYKGLCAEYNLTLPSLPR